MKTKITSKLSATERLIIKMKTLLLPILLLVVGNVLGQTTVFAENMGTPAGTTAIATYATGTAPATFQNKGTLTYSNGAQTSAGDLRTSSASSTYSGASGSGNVFFTTTSGAYGFSIESINASSYNTLNLQFGYRKESASLHATFSVDYWDGTSWITVANTSAALFNEAATATTGWYLSKTLSLPVGAQISSLKLRFVKTGTASIRIDDVKLTGTAATPTISTTGTLSAVNTTYGLASSTPTSFNVSGTNMTAGILVTPPAGYEVSLASGSGYASTVTVTGSGTIASTTVYARLTATATVAGSPYSGNIVLSSTSATSVNVATVSSTVTAKALTISGISANNKVLDGNTNATLSGTAALVGVVNSDVVTLGGTPVATFASSAAGTGIAVSVTGYSISGAGNYTLTQPTGLTADITASATPVISSSLTASAVYGTVASTYTITASESPTSYNATGLPAGLSINTANGEITGTPTAVPGNYNVTISATNAGGNGNAILVYTIAAKTLTIDGALADNKIYDRNTTATISGSTLVGVVGADVVTISGTGSFSAATVGNGIVVTSTQTLGGADAAKYTVTLPSGLSANITAKSLTIASAAAANKTFDGTNTATITGTLTGVVAPDVVPVALTGTFASTAIANGITVTSTSTIGGADAGNYTLTQPTGLTANITSGPTTLVAGDIAVVAINSSNPDKFSIVLLKAISTGTVINFTDNGFTGTDTTGRAGEGFLTYTANADLPIGSILTWNNGMTISGTGWSANAPTNFSFNGGGDQFFVFQGNTANWASQSEITLIYGLNYGIALSATSGASTTLQPNTSILPATAFLNLPTTTLANGYYSSTGATSSAVTLCGGSILADLVTSAKWFGTSGTAATFPTITYLAVCPVPTITGAATATAFTTTYGTASTAQTFSISGVNLTANLVATAPTSFEVAGDGATYGATASFAPTSGSASGTLSLRLKNSALVSGSYNNVNVVLSSTGATDVNITTAASGNSVGQKGLTITGISIGNKQYDTTTTATINGTAALSGVESFDTANVTLSGTPVANFDDATVGVGKAVTVSGYAISGSASANYLLSQPTGLTADISATAIPAITSALTAAAVYGEVATTYTITATETPTSFNATGLPTGLSVDTTTGAITGTPIANPGNYNINITATNAGGTGNATLVYTITAKNLTISGAAVNAKVYDGTNTASITGSTLVGIVGADVVDFTVTATFADANVGTGKTVTTNYTLSGADATKYAVTQPSLTGDITQAAQTITFAALPNKFDNAAPFALTATASSGLAVSYVSGNLAVATIAGNTVTIVGAGTTTITASQAGNSNYSAATDVNQSQIIVAIPTKFTTGNLVVARIGSGAAAVPTGGAGAPVYLDEYTITGTSGYSVAIPTATAGNVNRFVASGTSTAESQLNLSADGQYLTIGGYDMALGATVGSTSPRVIARISNYGIVATTPIGLVHTSGFRSVASTDGSRFWTAGNGTGVATIPFAGSTTSVVAPSVVSSASTNLRTASIYGNQLYYSTGSVGSTGTGIIQVGTGTPTASSQTLTNKIGAADPYGYYMVNRGGTNWNCYVGYNSGSGIYKWSSSDDRVTWTAQGSISTTVGVYSIVAQVNGNNVDLYASTPSSIVKLTDTAAYNATIAGSVSTIVTAPTNTIFRGLAFAPTLLAPVVTNTTLTASGTVDALFTNYTITAINSPATYNATGLPAGLSIDTATGVISGTPTAAGTFNVLISATNGAGTSATKTLVITIAKANQVITFGVLAAKDITDADFDLSATSTSNANPIVYTSSDVSIATISGNTVNIVGNTGNVTITASQVGNDNYNVATSVDQILTVSNALATNQTITFASLASATYGDAPLSLSATSDSGLTVTFTSSNPAVATVAGNVVTILNVGTTNIIASQGGNNDVNPASNVIQPLVINQKQLTIINAVVTTKTYDGTNTATVMDGTLDGIVGSDAVTFSGTATFNDVIANTNIPVTTTYTLGGSAVAKYTLLQPSLTGTIDKANQLIISFNTIQPKTTFDVDAALGSFSTTFAVNPVTYTSSDPSVLSILNPSAGVYNLHVVGPGFATITASQGASANYNAAPDVNQTIIVRTVLYRNQFAGVSACPTNGNTAYTAGNTTGTALTRSTIACNATANVFNSTTLNVTSTVNDASFIEFAVAAANGYKINVKSVSFLRQGSGSAPNQMEVRYSTDGFTTSTSWGAAPLTTTTGTTTTWDFADFTTVLDGTVTFRVYPYGTQRADLVTGAAAPGGTFRVDDVTIDGNLVQVITWNGSTWSNGTGPTIADEAEINGNYSTAASPAGNGTFSAKKLTINSGLFTVKSGTNLTVADQLVNSVTNTFASSVQTAGFKIENNGNLIQTATTNTNVGAIVSSRINTSMRRLDYTYWSSPTASATYSLKNFSPLTMSLTSTPQGGPSRFYSLSESDNAFVALDPLAAYFDASNIAKGFSIRAPNNFPTNGTTSTFNADFIGVPNNGNITIAATFTGAGKGSNLIGNPYPSTIDTDAFLTYSPDNNVTFPNAGTIYFWTHTTQNALGSANYASCNLSGKTAASAGGPTPNGKIQVGQGFILKKAAASTVVFTNAMREGNNDGQFFRIAATEKHRIWLNLATDTTPLNQIMVGYIEGTTLGFDDAYDGKLINSGSSIASLIDNENYVIQARPTPFVNTDEVPLNFKAATAGSYTLSIDHVDGLFLGEQNVYLKDKMLNVTHDIKASAYTFTSDQGTFADRFDVVYNNSTLNISTPTFDANSVIFYKDDNKVLNINAGKVIMKNVKIYDVRGRLVYEQSNINSTATTLQNLKAEQGVLLVKITSDDNKVITKKVVF